MKLVLILFCLCLSPAYAAIPDWFDRELDAIDTLEKRVQNVLNKDWFMIRDEDTLTIYFCRSCNDIDSTDFRIYNVRHHEGDSIRTETVKSYNLNRYRNFSVNGPDSVAFQTLVNPKMSLTDKDKIEDHQPEDILTIKIWFEEGWTKEKFQSAKARNDEIIKRIDAQNGSFHCPDLRDEVPVFSSYSPYLARYPHQFTKLPYFSSLISKAIFIENSCGRGWTYPVYIDKKDPFSYKNSDNSLHPDFSNTLYSIAYALGILDFRE